MTTTNDLPPGATSATEWDVDGVRLLGGTNRGERIHVDIFGIQRALGGVQWVANVYGDPDGTEVDAPGLRQLAADCVATADELSQPSFTAGRSWMQFDADDLQQLYAYTADRPTIRRYPVTGTESRLSDE
jgi:hypothetical protein